MTSEWRTEPLQGVVSYIAKGIPPVYVDTEGENTVRVLNQKCNREFTINYIESRLHDLSKRSVPQEKYLRNNDILINSTGTGTAGRIAQIHTVQNPTIIDGHMIILRSNAKVRPRYLGYALKAQQATVLQLDEGSTGQTELNRERLLTEIEISYPVSLVEQDAIVATLSALDTRISENKAINHNLEQMAQMIYKSWFVDFEPWGGKQPSNWREDNIYALMNVVYGTPFKSALFNANGVGYPLIRIRDLKTHTPQFYTPEKLPKMEIVQAGDVLVGMDAEFRPCIWKGEKGVLNQRVCKIVPNNRSVCRFFIYAVLTPHLEFIEHYKTGTTVSHIGKTDFDRIKIVIPPDSVLKDFFELIEPLYIQILNNSCENLRLTQIRDSLLPRLMSGELSVTDVKL